MRTWSTLVATAALFTAFSGCSSQSISNPTSDLTDGNNTTVSSLPAMYSHFAEGVEVFVSGSNVILRTDDLPDHPSPYFGAGDSRYETPQAGMVVNPNRIIEQDFEFTVPADPRQNANGAATNLGAIGIATNGVVLFNQYAGPNNAPLDNEIATFDRYNGHPQGTGQYHYHFEPVFITQAERSGLVGVLLDGFPVYGPEDIDGTTPTGLDDCNGHVGVTADHSTAIYHYHTTDAFPYISGCYRGTAGNVTN